MDIMVSSNFERMLFDLYERDGDAIFKMMHSFKETGELKLSTSALEKAREIFGSYRLDDDEMLTVIRQEFESTGYLLDPHTAIGVAAARDHKGSADVPIVCLATAHPAKFPDAVKKSGYPNDPELPHHMADLFERDEAYEVIEKDLSKVQSFIRENVRD